jgi:peptide/nickel transport system substrate-binding protein
MKRLIAGVALAVWPGLVCAQALVIGVSSEATSIDPHFADLGPNQATRQHIFDSLVHAGSNTEIEPGLAVSWARTADPLVWEFKLRQGVKFHDGTPFTAKDIAFSIARAPKVPNAPSTLSRRVADIASVEVIDDFTLRIHTKALAPTLLANMAYLGIVSAKIGLDAAPEDFNNGKIAQGTGPYRFVEFQRGDRIEVAANADYWGAKPRWQKVAFKPLTNARSRTAALLAGDVDVIADVPLVDVPRVKADSRFLVTDIASNRVMFWTLDVLRDQAEYVKALDGSPIPNPLKDLRVRQAMALVIDRHGIVERVMEGMAIPANQIVPEGFVGYVPDLVPPKSDIERARSLMAAAGYANGFALAIHTTNDRYVNDARAAQAVAQMLARIGIKVEVVSLPVALYYGRARKKEFTMAQIGWGNLTGDSAQVLHETLNSQSINNYGGWSNQEFDRLLARSGLEPDLAKREDLLRQATRLALSDVAIIPTHWQVNIWASKKAMRYVPRVDELTFAMNVVPNP